MFSFWWGGAQGGNNPVKNKEGAAGNIHCELYLLESLKVQHVNRKEFRLFLTPLFPDSKASK